MTVEVSQWLHMSNDLWLKPYLALLLWGYSDADWTSFVDDRRSTGGYVTFLGRSDFPSLVCFDHEIPDSVTSSCNSKLKIQGLSLSNISESLCDQRSEKLKIVVSSYLKSSKAYTPRLVDIFHMQSVTKEVERLCRVFLWGTKDERLKIHMTSWEKVCLPKAYGGLGFKEGTKWNYGMLSKYIWAIMDKKDLLWVKWVNLIYLKANPFWSHFLKPDLNWYWRKLCKLRRIFSREDIMKAGKTGNFKAALLYNSLLKQDCDSYYKAIWNYLNLPKHRFVLWQIVNSHLLTRDNLRKFHVEIVT
uniref:Reverse transcriptase zinc-binding domain-containing protein n=1 Tax=Cannabis sativa TaxID=3483 RepID=A0A803P0P7_CANSA